MIKKFYILFMILTIGIFLIPKHTYACGMNSVKKTEKFCCKKKKVEKSENRKCCNKDNAKSKKDQNSCDGKCGHASCCSPNICFTLALPFFDELNNNNIFGFVIQKQKFNDLETYLSTGFLSIWSPPNIG